MKSDEVVLSLGYGDDEVDRYDNDRDDKDVVEIEEPPEPHSPSEPRLGYIKVSCLNSDYLRSTVQKAEMSVKMIEGDMVISRRQEIFRQLSEKTAALRKEYPAYFTDPITNIISQEAAERGWNLSIARLIRSCVGMYNTIFFKNVLMERLVANQCKLSVTYNELPGFPSFDDRSVSNGISIDVQLVGGGEGWGTISLNIRPSSLIERMKRLSIRQTARSQADLFVLGLMDQVERSVILAFLYLWGADRPTIRQYECGYRMFFGEGFSLVQPKTLNVKLKTTKASSPSSPSSPTVRGFSWVANSCYADVLLMCLLGSSADYPRKVIFNTVTDNVEYNPASICEPGVTMTPKHLREIAARVQALMRSYYDDVIVGGKVMTCSTLRSALVECLPSMKTNGRWTYFDVSNIYALLTELFPALRYNVLAENVQVFQRPNGELNVQRGDRHAQHTGYHLFENYVIDSEREVGANTQTIWSTVNVPMLVFVNGGAPPIADYGSLSPETITEDGVTRPIPKGRVFAEYILGGAQNGGSSSGGGPILDRRYRLFGATLLTGVKPGQHDGTHYTAVVRVGEEWYSYDDMGPRFVHIGALPRSIFTDTVRSKPTMFFYERVKS